MTPSDEAYAKAASEIKERRFSDGLMAKAIADALGDKSKAEALYIKYRSIQIQSEIESRSAKRDDPNKTIEVVVGVLGLLSLMPIICIVNLFIWGRHSPMRTKFGKFGAFASMLCAALWLSLLLLGLVQKFL